MSDSHPHTIHTPPPMSEGRFVTLASDQFSAEHSSLFPGLLAFRVIVLFCVGHLLCFIISEDGVGYIPTMSGASPDLLETLPQFLLFI
ncbi:hypothetical protein CDV31_001019 [Fusarium ambrosium]|uniref:Uncharacterized protein n=1 Tax=Fusarium ambrosium TaxID=131363 RepID=A0A428V130_9HYPO|nr:hypothetical protein CDV31_001019 [Fusarium ambrosium]